jgi:hypothetical protein
MELMLGIFQNKSVRENQTVHTIIVASRQNLYIQCVSGICNHIVVPAIVIPTGHLCYTHFKSIYKYRGSRTADSQEHGPGSVSGVWRSERVIKVRSLSKNIVPPKTQKLGKACFQDLDASLSPLAEKAIPKAHLLQCATLNQ